MTRSFLFIFIENKLQYLQPLHSPDDLTDFEIQQIDTQSTAGNYSTPTYLLTIRGAPQPQITITAYGYMSELAREAMPTQLTPFNSAPLLGSLHKTGRLLVAEEGTRTLGWGAEIVASAAEATQIHKSYRVAALDLPVPASGPLEAEMLPGETTIIQAALQMVS